MSYTDQYLASIVVALARIHPYYGLCQVLLLVKFILKNIGFYLYYDIAQLYFTPTIYNNFFVISKIVKSFL